MSYFRFAFHYSLYSVMCVCVICMCVYYSIYQHKQSICGALNHTSLLCFRFIRCLKIRLCEKVQHVRSTPIGTFSAVKTTEIRTLDMRCEPYRQFNSLTECVGMLPPSINLLHIYAQVNFPQLFFPFTSENILLNVLPGGVKNERNLRKNIWRDICVKADRGRGDYGIGERMEALMTFPHHSSHLRGHCL